MKQLTKVTLVTSSIIAALLITGCVTLEINSVTEAPKPPEVADIVLIEEVELKVIQPGETFTAPNVPGVNNWYLISDYAMKKINNLQIDSARLQAKD